MRRIIRTLTTPAARTSAIYYFGNFLLNFCRYLFHLILLRLLLPSEYGEFLAYLSLLYILGIPNSAINSIVTRYVSSWFGKSDRSSINQFFYYLLEKLAPTTILMGIFLIFFSTRLAILFKAHPGAFVILGISMIINLFGVLLRGYLGAFQRFTVQIVLGVIENIVLLALTLIFIRMKLGATGVVGALIVSGLVGSVVNFFLIKETIIPRNRQRTIKFDIRGYSGFSLIYAIGSLSLISTDVLLVRYLFSEHLSGIYSALSILGRTIYFGLGPLIAIILPIASHRQAASKTSRTVFFKLGSVTLLFGLGATAIFVLFPKIIVALFSGTNYLAAAPLLPITAISMLLFSLNIFFISYLMAIGRPRANFLLLAATMAQPILIFVFHSDLASVVNINFWLEVFLFVSLLWPVKSSV